MRRWFCQSVRYTLLAAMDIDGFLLPTLEIVRRDKVSNEGAAGTVDSAHFERWIEKYLCPVLGSYENNEPRSIVIMDNASTHFGRKVGDAIRAKGAYLLDLNPIELGFNIYKNSLKRNMELGNVDWFEAHLNSISVIN